MKIALVHDHLNQVGGAENVLKAFHEMFPDAPVYTLIYDAKVMGDFCKDMDVRPSFIQRMPFAIKNFKYYIPAMPTAIERLDMSDYDIVLSSSSFAKGVITGTNTMHICYVHTPPRFLWSDTHDYTAELPTNKVVKKVLPFFLNYMRTWDKIAATRPDYLVGNSYNVSKRIKKYYDVDSGVIHPPVSLEKFTIAKPDEIGNYFVLGSRFRPYKRIDLAIKAFNKIGVPLKIFGSGEEEQNLRSLAGPNIEFLGKISNEEKQKVIARAQAFIFPQEEDFGITPLESMASGRPVIAYGGGGALETIVAGETGEFFMEQTPESLLYVLRRFKGHTYDPEAMRAHALTFGIENFKKEMARSHSRSMVCVSGQLQSPLHATKTSSINLKRKIITWSFATTIRSFAALSFLSLCSSFLARVLRLGY